MARIVEVNNNKELVQSVTNSLLCLFTAVEVGISMLKPVEAASTIGKLLVLAYDTHCDGEEIEVN